MYKDKFILAIKHNNKILRETKNIVQLPFNSEYSLLLKNENNRRALIKIKIDSQDVLYGSEIVLDANSETTIERFLQNTEYGNRFKFVKLSDKKVSDKDNPENGLVEVDFWLESEQKIEKFFPWWPHDENPYWPRPINPLKKREYDNDYEPFKITWFSPSINVSKTYSVNSVLCSSIQSQNLSNINSQENLGATIEGSKSNQKFQDVFTREKDLSTHIQIRLWLRATENPLYVEDTKNKFCSQCGKKLQYKDKFCSQCGINVENN